MPFNPGSTTTANAAKPRSGPLAAGGGQRISRLEAKGGVTVIQKDQTATGDTGYFDMRANTVTLKGNVTVIQGKSVMQGDRLIVDMTTGVSRVEGSKPVRLMIDQDGGNAPVGPGAASGGGTNPNGARQSPFAPPKFGPKP